MNKKTLIFVVIIIITAFAFAVYFLIQRTPVPSVEKPSPTMPSAPTTTESFVKVKNPTIQNPKADFGGTHYGDFIQFTWSPATRTQNYIFFRSLSIGGPWEEFGNIPGSLTNGIDSNPEVRKQTFCYRLEARDEKNLVVRHYEPICVPKYEK